MSRLSLSRKPSTRKFSNDTRVIPPKDEKPIKEEEDQKKDDVLSKAIFGDVPLTDNERRFLSASETGNLEEIKLCIQETRSLDLNCRDYLNRTGLQLAVIGEHYEAIQFLLDKCNLDIIEEGLLHAIKTENIKVCDMFLSHPIYSDSKARRELEFQHGFYDQEENNSSFSPDITPIVLAAQCNNFDIVHMLIQRGFTIQTPHHYFCYCTECTNHKLFDRFVHSRSRLNAYTGLGSSAYLSLSSDDPIGTAFELSRSLQILAETEKEYKHFFTHGVAPGLQHDHPKYDLFVKQAGRDDWTEGAGHDVMNTWFLWTSSRDRLYCGAVNRMSSISAMLGLASLLSRLAFC